MDKTQFDRTKIIKKLTTGRESNIYLYGTSNTVLKYFKTEIEDRNKNTGKIKIIHVEDKVFNNKEEKIKILSEEKALKDNIEIKDLVYDEDGKFVGYTTTYKDVTSFDALSYKSQKEKIELLKKLRNKMEILNKNNIYIGDFVNPNNFATSNDKIILFDIDNFRVNDLDFDYKNIFVEDYLKHNNQIDNIDTYCFNYFTISFYTNRLMSYIDGYLRINGLPRKFNTPESRELLKDLLNNKCPEKKYLLDYQRKGLFK